MKRTSVRMILSIALLALINLSNVAYAVEVDNAAVYYSKAFDLQKYNESAEMKERIQKVIRKGWSGQDPELEQFILDNEAALKEVVEGLKLGKCDFDYGRRYSYIVEKKTPPLTKIMRLSTLFLLRGRYLESQDRSSAAVNDYFYALQIARQLALDMATISKLSALQIEERATPVIRDFINKRANKKDAENAVNFLKGYLKDHFSMRQVVKDEKAMFLSTIKTITDKLAPDLAFKKEFVKEAGVLADKYYNLIADATDPGNQDLFAAVEREISSLRQELKGIDRQYLERIIKNEEKDLNKVTGTQVVKYLLVIGLPELKKTSAYYHGRIFDLRALQEAAEKKKETFSAVQADTTTNTNDVKGMVKTTKK
ncbi:MAG: hypothetical protein PHD29_07075 [bacterium]|nr:hypothetical protein [bacterium]MDD5353837.1 hypothetical protein [bacterium]MDD5756709.1 hypothetical protein [bacterium]